MPRHGKVVETQGELLIFTCGTDPVEHNRDCPNHGAGPGDYILIHDDGSVEITGRIPPEPENIPVPGPQHDHS